MRPVIATGYLLVHTATILMRQSDQVLQERLGIGMSQLKLLMILEDSPSIRQRKLAECLGQTEASVSRQIKLLQDKGLLSVRINPKSRREHLTMPTAKGQQLTRAALEILEQYHTPTFAALDERSRKQLQDMLVTLHGHVCATGKPFSCDHSFGL